MSTVDEHRRRTAANRTGTNGRSRPIAAGDARSRARIAARRRRKRRQRRIIIGIGLLILLLLAVIIGRTVFSYRNQKEKNTLQTEGIAFLEQGNYDAAIRNFDQIIEMSKGKTGNREKAVLMYKAEAEYKKGNYQAAVEVCDSLIAADGEKDEYLKLKSRSQIELGEYDQALSYLPLAPVIYNRMAVQAIKDKRYEEALANIESGLALGESEVSQFLLVNQAVAYTWMGDFQKALKLFESYVQKYGSDENIETQIEFLKTR
ncbi:MAG: tetratricopeptide repeat protein [Lachnospiraceae bacterium]